MKHKQQIKKALAGFLACAVIGTNALPAAQQFSLLSPLSVTASAASCCSFNASTGVLTLSGNVTKSAVFPYRNDTRVKSVVCANGTVFPEDCSYMFENFKAVSMDLSKANTSAVKKMGYMFINCKNMTALDVSHFNTLRCTTMQSMFQNCEKLKKLDLSSFDVRSVTDLSHMFENCKSLTNLDVHSFAPVKCTTLCSMFAECASLTYLDLETLGYDTGNVTNMSFMFNDCV